MNYPNSRAAPDGLKRGLRSVLLVSARPSSNVDWEGALLPLGLSVQQTLTETHGLLARVTALKPQVLIIEIEVPDEAILSELTRIHQAHPLPVVLFSNAYSPGMCESVIAAGVSSYIVDSVRQDRLSAAIDLAIARFAQVQALYRELALTRVKLEERKLIERAKGIIMKQKRFSESEAYTQLRQSAMNQGLTIAELARRVIAVFDE